MFCEPLLPPNVELHPISVSYVYIFKCIGYMVWNKMSKLLYILCIIRQVTVATFEVLFQHSLEGTEGHHKNLITEGRQFLCELLEFIPDLTRSVAQSTGKLTGQSRSHTSPEFYSAQFQIYLENTSFWTFNILACH